MCEKTLAERIIMKSSVAKYDGCKRARQCGLISNGRNQANREFSCARNLNCCFARCAETRVSCPLTRGALVAWGGKAGLTRGWGRNGRRAVRPFLTPSHPWTGEFRNTGDSLQIQNSR